MSGGSSSPSRDPYKTLGLNHNASPTQIKVAYRKLALKYHPDRQKQSNQQQQEEATTKFSEISSAYALLSDPTKKSQYDHLYKFGAFDSSEMRDDAADTSGSYRTNYRNHNNATSGSGYKYTENLSGGYYTNKASTGNNTPRPRTSSSAANPTATSPPPPFFNFIGLQKQDSFFDELLHTPKKKKASSFHSSDCDEQENQQQRTNTTSPPQQQQQPPHKRSGIGFSMKPMGKHLSIHVPSKSEIISCIASGEPLPNHNFGTRVTFSTSSKNNKNRSTASLISTTTRIAHGQQRTVKRIVYIQPDGRREEVIEEDGVVKRRHVEELCPPPSSSAAAAAVGGKDTSRQENQAAAAAASCHGWHSGVICGLRDCVLGSCLGLQGM